MTIEKINRTIKGVAELKLLRLSDNAILHLPKPTGFTIDNAIDQRIQMTQNSQGETTRASSYIKGRMPTLRVVYSHLQPETLQFKIGNEFEPKTQKLNVVKDLLVTQALYAAVTDTARIGKNVVIDEPTQAAISRDNESVQLVQQPFSTFDGAVNDTFAVGAGFALKFSDNLVTAQETVSIVTSETFTGRGIADNLVGAHKIRASLITTNNEVIIFKADNLTPSFDGASIDSNAESVEIPFFINQVPGQCFPYEFFYTGKFVGC
ncbi:hypothetical protein [Scytonema sp. NUACC26]|uniref:hypothetical protein n=1 Tax=Scytonema sp. NUACC26 TaxID=3140176 RepID=UPI0034DC63DF